ncbi:MAG: hypothetical protein ACXVCY_00180 [Pseudobdellovibrionaceae bacterium]
MKKYFTVLFLIFTGLSTFAHKNSEDSTPGASDEAPFYYQCRVHDNFDGENFWGYCRKNLSMIHHKTYMGTWLAGKCISMTDEEGNEHVFLKAKSGLVGTLYSSHCFKVQGEPPEHY